MTGALIGKQICGVLVPERDDNIACVVGRCIYLRCGEFVPCTDTSAGLP